MLDQNQARLKTLFQYVLPSVGGLLVAFIYVVVDGIFVGQGIGVHALGAVNIVLPFVTIAAAFFSMIAIGGSTVIAVRQGRGDHKGANEAFMTSLILGLVCGLGVTAAGMLLPAPISRLLGASPTFLPLSAEYMFYMSMFFVFWALSICLAAYVRNDGAPGLAFWGLFSGALANIFLDWLFVFPLAMGLKGAALASGLGETLALLVLSTHFIRKQGRLRLTKFTLSLKLCGKIIKRGFPEFVSQLGGPVTVLCYNLIIGKMLGDMGISAFSVLNYVFSIFNAIIFGISEGIQPLWGQSYGEKNQNNLKYYFRTGLLLNLVASTAFYGLVVIWGEPIVHIFNGDPQLASLATAAFPAFGWSFIFMGANTIMVAYLYSTKRTMQSTIISLSRSLLFKVPAILFIPMLLGTSSIWHTAGIAEALTCILGIILVKASERQGIRFK